MLRRYRWAALAAAVVACWLPLADALPARAATQSELRATVVDAAFVSRGLAGTLRYEAFLPEGYRESGKRYPVVYFLHGLPAGPDAYRGAAFVAAALAGKAIVVAPQGARAPNSDPEYRDWGPGRNWEAALTSELPRVIDARYRTIPTRAGRALIGISAGGYGAAVLGLHHLGEFAVVESWSGYFHATDPTGASSLDLGDAGANAYASVHTLVPLLRERFRRAPTFFGFYVGRDDGTFRAENERLHRELTAAGVRHAFAEYPGGHQQTLWQAQARRWLGLALAHLATAR